MTSGGNRLSIPKDWSYIRYLAIDGAIPIKAIHQLAPSQRSVQSDAISDMTASRMMSAPYT